jgi:hypothetical protein
MQVEEDVVSEIDVKQAVALAKDYATSLYESEKISQLGLEAVERTEDGKYWRVTLGFARPWTAPKPIRKHSIFKTPLEQALSDSREPKVEREYKVFRVDAQSGAVVGMEMFDE